MRYIIEDIKKMSFDELDELGVNIKEVKTGFTTISKVNGFDFLENLEKGIYKTGEMCKNKYETPETIFDISFNNSNFVYKDKPASEIPFYIFKYLIIEDIVEDTKKLKEKFLYLIERDKNGEIDSFIISNKYFLLSEKALAFKSFDLKAVSIENAEIDYIKHFLNQRNPKEKARRLKYEKFKLNWMLDHEYTLKDLFNILENYSNDYACHCELYPSVSELKEVFSKKGFYGDIYPSFEEWLENEEKKDFYN